MDIYVPDIKTAKNIIFEIYNRQAKEFPSPELPSTAEEIYKNGGDAVLTPLAAISDAFLLHQRIINEELLAHLNTVPPREPDPLLGVSGPDFMKGLFRKEIRTLETSALELRAACGLLQINLPAINYIHG